MAEGIGVDDRAVEVPRLSEIPAALSSQQPVLYEHDIHSSQLEIWTRLS